MESNKVIVISDSNLQDVEKIVHAVVGSTNFDIEYYQCENIFIINQIMKKGEKHMVILVSSDLFTIWKTARKYPNVQITLVYEWEKDVLVA